MNNARHPAIDASTTCACGMVSISISGDVVSMLLCSCMDCQRATGSGHSSVAIISEASVTVAGKPKSYARTADSGAIFTRSFCPECGTPLFGRSSRAPQMIMLPVGLFAGSNEWFAPNQLIFARSHQDWDWIDAALPQHETYRSPPKEDARNV